VLVEGQSGDVNGLAVHPLFPQIYATACTDGTVCVWDAERRENTKVIDVIRGSYDTPTHYIDNDPTKHCYRQPNHGLKYFCQAWEGRVRPRGRDSRTSRAMMAAFAPEDTLRAEACAFNHQANMLAVSTSGVVDGTDSTHPDQGGCILVYQVDAELLSKAEDAKDKDDTPPKVFEAKVSSSPIEVIAFSPNGWFLALGSHDAILEIFDTRS
jgi:WD40 repeat protein